jgi:2-polyprenyl-3-methyl-5-hydroxy-6-metoxy-1,4-benzoquinol methylase
MDSRFTKEPSGYLRVNPLPTPDSLASYYSSEYYQNPHGTYSEEYTQEELVHKEIRNLFIYRLATESFADDKNLNFLDVGCGEGFLMKTFLHAGWSTTGLDFSDFGVKKFNSELVPFIRKGNVYDSIAEFIDLGKKFDCVNLGNVLEHVLEPKKLLEDLSLLMNPNSIILITVPNDFSTVQEELSERGLIEKQYWVAIPDHLNYFTAPSLKALSTEAGFEVSDIFADFPIEWFQFNRSSNYSLEPGKGRDAHVARVMIDSLITRQQDFNAVKNFWSSLAGIGHGRVITAVCKKAQDR